MQQKKTSTLIKCNKFSLENCKNIYSFLSKCNLFAFFVGIIAIYACFALVPSIASAAGNAELAARVKALEIQSSHIWTAVAVMVVFLMKGGFMLFEAGLVRAKNTINTAQKNLSDTLISIAIFYMFGFNLMFGETIGGWVGWHPETDLHDVDHTFFLYQVVFSSMVATVVSGAMAERIKFSAYIMSTIFVTAIIYPVFGHWVWGNIIIPENEPVLATLGFMDFAGGVTACAVGGFVALAGVIVIGPRHGRYNADGKRLRMPANNVVLAAFGTVVIWVGALAFNSGLAHAGSEDVAHIMSNTLLAGAMGGLASLIAGRLRDGLFRPERCIYGVLGGIAAIAAGCNVFSIVDTVIVGFTGGIIVVYTFALMVRVFKWDDVVCAIPINGMCGAWGALLIGPLGNIERFDGLTRMEQWIAQLQGVGVAVIWAFGASYIFFKLVHKFYGLRVTTEEEIEGLNSAEHGVTMGTGVLQEKFLDLVRGEGDLTTRLDTTTGDESAEIATIFNEFVEKIQALMISIQQNAKIIGTASVNLNSVAGKFSTGFHDILSKSTEVSMSSGQISDDLGSVSEVITEVSQNVSSISESAEMVSESIVSISHEMENMSEAIRLIAQNTNDASSVAGKADDMIGKATTVMKSLNETVDSIDDIVHTIHDIAKQTNMLGLNATVEASRAGEAGKGFAVVAEEVQSLASKTSEATRLINQKILDIQKETGSTSEIIKDLHSTIRTINSSLGSISNAVNEQSDATRRISQKTVETRMGSKSIADEISEIAKGAESASHDVGDAVSESKVVMEKVQEFMANAQANTAHAENVKVSVKDLSAIAKELEKIVNQYKIS